MNKKDIRKVFNELSVYFGLRHKDSFVKVATGEPNTEQTGKISKDPEIVTEVFDLLFSDTHSFMTGEDIRIKMDAQPELFADKIRYTPAGEKEMVSTKEKSVNSFYNRQNKAQGWGIMDRSISGGSGFQYILNDIRPKGFNQVEQTSVFQCFPAKRGLDVSDTDIASLFLNALPTIMLSRAMPYLEIGIFDNVEVADGNFLSSPSISLSKFLGVSQGDSPADPLFGGFLDSAGEVDKTGKGMRQVSGMEVFTTPQTMVDRNAALYSREAGGPADKFRPFMSIQSLTINDTATGAAKSSYKTASLSLILHDKGRLSDIARLVAPRRLGSTRFQLTYGWSHPDGNMKMRRTDADAMTRIGDLIDAMKVTETYKPSNSSFSFEKDGSVKIELELVMAGTNKVSMTDLTVLTSTDGAAHADVGEIAKILSRVDQHMKNQADSLDDLDVEVPTFLTSPSWESLVTIDGRALKKLNSFLESMEKSSENKDLKTAASLVLGLLDPTDANGALVSKIKKDRANLAQEICNRLRSSPDPFLRPGKGVTAKNLGSGNRKKDFSDPLKKSKKGNVVGGQNYVSYGKLMVYMLQDILQETSADVQFVFSAFNRDAAGVFDYNIAQFPILIDLLQEDLADELKKSHKFSISDFVKMIGEKHIEFHGSKAYGLNKIYVPNKRGTDAAGQYTKKVEQAFDKDRLAGKFDIETKQIANLDELYGKGKRTDPTFVCPLVNMRIETRPATRTPQSTKNKIQSVTKVCFFDECCGSTMSLGTAMSTLLKGNFFYTEDYSSDTTDTYSANHQDVFNSMVNLLKEYKFVKPLVDQSSSGALLTDLKKNYQQEMEKKMPARVESLLRMKIERTMVLTTDQDDVKNIFFGFSPYLIYGSEGSGLVEAQVSSEQNENITSIAIAKRVLQQADPDEPTKTPMELPMQVHPATVSATTFGCPLLRYGQKYFIDFGTGTTIDNYYAITEINHTISSDTFTTDIQLTPQDAYGRFINASGMATNQVISALSAGFVKKKKRKGKGKSRAKKQGEGLIGIIKTVGRIIQAAFTK